MDTEASLRTLLSTANFGVRTKDAIVEFCCDNLNDLSTMSTKDLDIGIANLHKSMSSLAANHRVRLNLSKCILLHAISPHFYDHSLCFAPLEAADIAALVANNIIAMKTDYAKSTLDHTTTGLGEVILPKIARLKWTKFKYALSKLLGRSISQNKIPLLYVICANDVGDFDEAYDDRRSKLTMYISHNGPSFKADTFSILVQHTGSSEGASLVQSNEQRCNGRKAWKEFPSHF
mmetsp:Transcript_11806/g.14464  ORF Transcript_11806/g.14464 Transcript_11806/m.14464 type:complete len:233 (+) Transcript_11806:148-846(+)